MNLPNPSYFTGAAGGGDGTEGFHMCRCPAGALLAANMRARAAAGGCLRACSSGHVLRNAGLGPLRPTLSPALLGASGIRTYAALLLS